MVKNECGQFVLWTLRLTVNQGRTERTELTDFLHAGTISHKLKGG